MSTLYHTVKINAPPEKVWEALADLGLLTLRSTFKQVDKIQSGAARKTLENYVQYLGRGQTKNKEEKK